MRKLLSLVLFAATAATAALAPATAEARMVCKRVWVHGHLVRRCHHVSPPRHYHHHRRPPPPHRGPPPRHR